MPAVPYYTDRKRNQIMTMVRLVPDVRAALDAAVKAQDVSRNRLVNEILAKEFGVSLDMK